MSLPNNDNSNEEIEEDIKVDQCTDTANECTYDKFLLESVVLPNQHKNECQQLLNSKMKEIIGDIKQREAESHKSKDSKKRQMLQGLSKKFNMNQPEPELKSSQSNVDKTANHNSNRHIESNHMKLVPDLNESNEELYHINFEDFTQENTKDYMTQEEVYVNRSNNNLQAHLRKNDVKFGDNQLIVNQNDTVCNNNTSNFPDNTSYENHLNVQDLSSFSNMTNPPDSKSDKQKVIEENYSHILQSKKNAPIVNQYDKYNSKSSITSKAKPREEVDLNQKGDQRLIVVENYSNEEDMRKKEEKLKRLREKKIKEQEQKRQKSKGALQRPSTAQSEQSKQVIAKSNQPIAIKSEHSTNKSNSKVNVNIISNQSNNSSLISTKAKQKPSTAVNSSSTTSGNESLMSRVPVKIQREESLLANKKIKSTVKYASMSNKKKIKKAINEVCLAGQPNRECRDKIIDVIDKCDSENYIILFKGNYGRFDLRGVYTFDASNEQIELLTCLNNAPNFIDFSMVSSYFKYDLSQNKFKELPGNKEFSVIVDGINMK